MSKIYEALLRAEQERAATAGKAAPVAVAEVYPADPTSSAELEEPLAIQAVAVEAPVAAFPARVPVAEPSDEVFDAPPVERRGLSASSAFEAARIPTRLWQPVLEKLPALEERGSSVEQFRTLRTRLFAFRDLNALKSIMVSSGLPREGKSFIAANLAISFARHKASRVLLIDGDMRRSSLHTLLGCEKSPGLTEYLSGKCTAMEVMQRAQLNADGTKLFAGLGSLVFIGGGEEGDKAADLAGSKRFRDLLELAGPHFDWIIVDSSPVNLVTDGVNLAAACDAVLLVARGGVTRFETAQRAMGELKASKILGVVLNAADIPRVVDGYYGYDGYDSPTQSSGPDAS